MDSDVDVVDGGEGKGYGRIGGKVGLLMISGKEGDDVGSVAGWRVVVGDDDT